jgi:hypothetical protein
MDPNNYLNGNNQSKKVKLKSGIDEISPIKIRLRKNKEGCC